MLPPHPSKDLVSVCEAFSDLQSACHEADYDLSVPILRREAIRRWTDAETALKKFRTLQRSDELTVFVLGCLLGEALKKNS